MQSPLRGFGIRCDSPKLILRITPPITHALPGVAVCGPVLSVGGGGLESDCGVASARLHYDHAGPAPGVSLEGPQVGRVLDPEGVRRLLVRLQKDH